MLQVDPFLFGFFSFLSVLSFLFPCGPNLLVAAYYHLLCLLDLLIFGLLPLVGLLVLLSGLFIVGLFCGPF